MVNVEYKYTLESHAVYNSITHQNNGFLEFGNIFFFCACKSFISTCFVVAVLFLFVFFKKKMALYLFL